MGLSWLKLIGEGQKQTTSFPANTAAPLRAIFRLNNVPTLDVLLARAIGITGNRSSRIKFSRLIEDRKQKHSCRNTEGWLRRITKENWENWSEVGRGNRFRALAKDPSRRPCFVFCHGVGRKGDGYDAFLRAGKTNVNGTRRNGFERATSIRLPLRSVDGCHRPLVGNSNFKSRFRDYSAGNESVEEKEEEKRERERERKKEKAKSKREQRIRDRWWLFLRYLPSVPRGSWKGRSFLSINSLEELATLRVTWRLSRFGIIGGERKVWAVLSKPAGNKSLRREIKGEQFRSWIEMDIHGFDSRRRRWWQVFPE